MVSIRRRIKGIKDINWRDTTIFTLSVLLAFSIWTINGLSQYFTTPVRVPVIAVSGIDGFSKESVNSVFIEANCRTTGFGLLRIKRAEKAKPIKVEFKPSDLHQTGSDLFYATASEINNYSKVIYGDVSRIDGILVDTVFFRFLSEKHKKVPVLPICSISYKEQYIGVGNLQLSPDSVIVYGESSLLDNISKVSTKAFHLEDLSASTKGNVKIEQIKGVRMSVESIDYSLRVERYVELQAQIQVFGRNVPSDRELIISPSYAKVTFKCAFPVVGSPIDDSRVYIDYKDFSSSINGDCVPKVSVPENLVFDCSVEPKVFSCIERER